MIDQDIYQPDDQVLFKKAGNVEFIDQTKLIPFDDAIPPTACTILVHTEKNNYVTRGGVEFPIFAKKSDIVKEYLFPEPETTDIEHDSIHELIMNKTGKAVEYKLASSESPLTMDSLLKRNDSGNNFTLFRNRRTWKNSDILVLEDKYYLNKKPRISNDKLLAVETESGGIDPYWLLVQEFVELLKFHNIVPFSDRTDHDKSFTKYAFLYVGIEDAMSSIDYDTCNAWGTTEISYIVFMNGSHFDVMFNMYNPKIQNAVKKLQKLRVLEKDTKARMVRSESESESESESSESESSESAGEGKRKGKRKGKWKAKRRSISFMTKLQQDCPHQDYDDGIDAPGFIPKVRSGGDCGVDVIRHILMVESQSER